MRLSDFDYELPERLIARYPLPERRASRLLVVADELSDRRFEELPELLEPGDLLVFNDTRVIPARLQAVKATGGRAEILIERILDSRRALAHVRASKTPKPGGQLLIGDQHRITVLGRAADLFELGFDADVGSVLERYGRVPLPPYLGREAEPDDRERYQTVYAREAGAVAAPTAGLHFDEAMLEETRAMGVGHAWITLHVGAGTFQPLRCEEVGDNRLHVERVHVGADCVQAVAETQAAGGRVIAVGTTAVRSLESASANGGLEPYDGETDLFIVPGYRFRTVDAMITNFHLPQSSLMMLVAAFAGRERILHAYRHAVEREYRFFSYGDSMFLHPETGR